MVWLNELDDADLEKIVCGECEETGVEKEHRLLNLAVGLPLGVVGGVVFYYWDIPFGPKYVCNNCDYELEDGDVRES